MSPRSLQVFVKTALSLHHTQIRQITPKQSCSALSLVLFPWAAAFSTLSLEQTLLPALQRTLMEKEQQPSSWNIKGKSDTAKEPWKTSNSPAWAASRLF